MLRTRLRSPRQGHRCASGSCLRGCAPVFRPATYHRASCSPLHRRASTDLDLHPAHCAIVPLAMGRESKRITPSIKQGTCETINVLVVLKVRQIYAPLGSPETGHHSLARHYPDGGQRFYGSGDSQSWAERPRRQRCWRVVPQRSWSACRSVPSPGWANLNNFFNEPGTPFSGGELVSDPRCIYDKPTDTFFLTALAACSPAVGCTTTESHIDLVVYNPNSGAAKEYKIDDTFPTHPGCPCLGDQEKIGVDNNAIYLSVDEFEDWAAGGTIEDGA